jgi:hypothetical protein
MFLVPPKARFAASARKQGGGGGPTDPYFSNVSLLLPFDGANGSTTFTDKSNNELAVTATSGVEISTSQSRFGGSSAFFPSGGTPLLSLAPTPVLEFSGDFTIEMDVRPGSTADMIIGSSSSDGNTQIFRLNEGGSGTLSFFLNGTAVFSATAAGIVVDAWQHLAIARSGSSTRMFVDGVQVGSTNTSWSGTFRMDKIGLLWFSGSPFSNRYTGFIDNLRITKGIARYTANFTPPTAPFPDS